MKIFFIQILLLASFAVIVQGQDQDPAEMFGRMKSLVEAGDDEAALELGYSILGVRPGYTDVQVYLALIHGRLAEYNTGLALLEPVLALYPDHSDAHLAKCSLLYWSNRWSELLAAAEAALEHDPVDGRLLYMRGLAYYKLGELSGAISDLKQVTEEDSEYEQARALLSEIYLNSENPEIFARYLYDHFTQPYLRRWHMVTLGGNYPITRGLIQPYFNTGHFVDASSDFISTTAFQVNADAYLNITDKNYLLAGYGIGAGSYLPRHRAILHIWQVLPQGWAISGGGRYFYFDQHYLFYALGAEKYLGNYWIELKSYIFNKEYGPSLSGYLTVRRYFENRHNYLSLTTGYGTSPDEPYTSIAELQRLKALSFRLSIMRQVSGRVRIGAGAGYQYEAYRELEYRHRISVQAGVYYKIERN